MAEKIEIKTKYKMVKLEAPVALLPKEYRLKLAEIAAQLNYSAFKTTDRVRVAKEILRECGIVEAQVPETYDWTQDEVNK